MIRPAARLCLGFALSSLLCGQSNSISPLIDLLRSQSLSDQQRAESELAAAGAEAVLPVIELLADSDWRVQSSAIIVLQSIRDPRAVAPLIRIMDDPNPSVSVRELAARALSTLKDARAIPHLISALDDPEGRVSEAALVGLKSFNDVDAAAALEGLPIRLISKLRSMEKLGPVDPRFIETFSTEMGLLRSSAAPSLIELLKDSNVRTRGIAARLLGVKGYSTAVAPLIEALKEKVAMQYVAEALGEIGDKRAVQPLADILNTLPASEIEKFDFARSDFGAVANALFSFDDDPVALTALQTAVANGRLPREEVPDRVKIVVADDEQALLKFRGDSTFSARITGLSMEDSIEGEDPKFLLAAIASTTDQRLLTRMALLNDCDVNASLNRCQPYGYYKYRSVRLAAISKLTDRVMLLRLVAYPLVRGEAEDWAARIRLAMTARQITSSLPDLALATEYRHIKQEYRRGTSEAYSAHDVEGEEIQFSIRRGASVLFKSLMVSDFPGLTSAVFVAAHASGMGLLDRMTELSGRESGQQVDYQARLSDQMSIRAQLNDIVYALNENDKAVSEYYYQHLDDFRLKLKRSGEPFLEHKPLSEVRDEIDGKLRPGIARRDIEAIAAPLLNKLDRDPLALNQLF